MDKVLNALKCANCTKTLASPIFLPCGHMICQEHTLVPNDTITCCECGVSHPNKGFTVAKAFADMISAEIARIDFGPKHKQSKESCDQLKKKLDENDVILNDMDFHIHETIDEMKIKVLLKREQLKVRIDQVTQELLDDLEDYEKRCKSQRDESNGQVFVYLMKKFKDCNDEARKNLNEWQRVLNELKIDEDKWMKIKEKSDETLKEVGDKLNEFEKDLFMHQLESKQRQVEVIEKANIDKILNYKVGYFVL